MAIGTLTSTQTARPTTEVRPRPESAARAAAQRADQVLGARQTSPTVKVSGPTHSEAEIREMFQKKIMPGVHKGLEAMGGNNNESRCDTASAMVQHSLNKLGVGGARIVEGDGHVFVEVKTKEGKTLLLDPTMAQFVKDGTAFDKEVRQNGWAGTKEELAETIHRNKENYHFNESYLRINSDVRERYASGDLKEAHDAIVHGRPTKIDQGDLKAIEPDVQKYRRDLVGQHHYPENVQERFSRTARENLAWWEAGGQTPRMVVAEKGQPASDQADRYRAGFTALEQALR